MEQLQVLVEYLVRQQFYEPEDIILDRTKIQKIHIRTSGQAVNQFTDLLSQDLSEIVTENYRAYLEKVKLHFDFELEKLFQSFSNRISLMEPGDRAVPLLASFLLGELLGDIRERVFEQYLQEIKTRYKTQFTKNEDAEKFEQDFKQMTCDSFERNDPNIAIIYNLCFLEFIARVVKDDKLKRTSRILLGKYMNRFVRKLCQT